MKKLIALLVALAVLAACAPATPEVIEKEVVVEKPVVETVIVEKPVVETVIVEKEVVVTPVPKPTKVTLGFVHGAFAPQEKWEAYFSSFLEAHPNVEINYFPVPLESWGQYTEKIVTLIVGGEDVDVIWNAINGTPLMAEKGVLMDLQPYMDRDSEEMQEYVDDVHPKLLEGLTWKGGQYLLPFAWNNVLMFYNIKVFGDAGLAEPAKDWTWDDFLAAALTITTDKDGDGTNDVWGFSSSYTSWSAGPWPISNGSYWMNEDFSEPWYDKPETIEALQFAHDLVWEYEVAPSGDFPYIEQFAAGNLGMFGGAPATREVIIPTGLKTDEYNINLWPTNTGEVIKGSIWGADGYGIAARSEHKDLAWELVKYLVSKEVMSNLVSGTSASGSCPARRSLATGPELAAASPSNYLYWYESLDAAWRTISSPNAATLDEIHNRYLSQAWAQEMTIEEACAMIQKDMEAEIGQ